MPRYRRRIIEIATFIALLPMVLILLTALMATLLGCEVNEALPQACYVLGSDFGELLTGLMNIGWLGLILIPIMMCLVPLWLLLEWLLRSVRKRREKREANSFQSEQAA